MHIIHTPARYSSTGGVESYVRCLSEELAAIGHEVTVIAADSPGVKPDTPGVTVRYLNTAFSIANTNITPRLLPNLLKIKCDIVHTHLPTPWTADMSMIDAKVQDVPLVITYHNDIKGRGIYDTIARLYNATALELLLRAADRIIVTRAEFLSPHLRRYRDRLRVVPPGIDAVRFHPTSGKQEADIFFLSVLDAYHQYKELGTLIEAVALLKRDHPAVRLVVGGDGPMKEYYREMATRLGLADNVVFHGYIPEHELPGFYQRCRTFVLPSSDPEREGFGMVLLEAMACGKPVVTTEIAGVAKDIVAADAGVVVPRRSAPELADALSILLSSEERRSEIGTNARRLITEHYTWSSIARRVESVYQEISGK